MSGIMQLGEVTAAQVEQFVAIYEEALPASERKPVEAILGYADRSDYRVLLLEENSAIVGFAILFAPPQTKFVLLEYMAVARDRRGRGLGSALFTEAAALFPDRTMLMEVETADPGPGRADRVRRLAFYARLGCVTIPGLVYRMPDVGQGTPPDMHLLLLRPPAVLGRERVRRWIMTLYRQVYGQGEPEAAVAAMVGSLPERMALEEAR